MQEKYFTKQQASDLLTNQFGLPVASKTLSKLITVGGGPKYHKFGKRVVYLESDLIQWANSRLSLPLNNSSEQGA